jgi:signal transduction histidine kinase
LSDVKRVEELRDAISTEVVAGYIRGIREKAEDIIRAPATAPLSAEEGVTTQLLNPMIEQRINDRIDTRGAISISFDLGETLGRSVRVSEPWFGHAFNLILNNAARALERAAGGKILVRTEMRDAAHCLIMVSNTGPRIPDDIWEKLGNEPINNGDKASGLGIGILLADMILGVYGGKWVKLNNEGGKVTVGITMPVSGD